MMSCTRLSVIQDMETREFREKLVSSAFTAFQLGAGGDKPFLEYLSAIGLADKTTAQPVKAKPTTADILKKSQNIRERAVKQRLKDKTA